MAAAGAVRAGRAFIEIFADTTQLRRQLSGLRVEIGNLSRNMRTKIGNSVASGNARMQKSFSDLARRARWSLAVVSAAIVGVGAAMARLGASAFTQSERAADALFRFRLVFGDAAKDMEKWSVELSDFLHLDPADVQSTMAGFRSIFTGFGFDDADANAMTQKLTRNVVDFAAATGQTMEEAGARFISMLEGESESLDRFGINTKEAALNAQLLAMGFPKIADGATEAEKVLARLAITQKFMEQTDFAGAAEKKLGTFTGAIAAAKNELTRLFVAIGDALSEALAPFAGDIINVITGMRLWVEANKQSVVWLAKMAARILGIGAAGGALFILWHAGTLLAVVFGTISAAVELLLGNLGIIVSIVGSIVAAWATLSDSGKSAIDRLSEGWRLFGEMVPETWDAVLTAIRSGDIQAAIDAATQGIRVAWLSMKTFLVTTWYELLTNIEQQPIFQSITQSISNFTAAAGAFIDTLMNQLKNFAVGFARTLVKIHEFIMAVGAAGLVATGKWDDAQAERFRKSREVAHNNFEQMFEMAEDADWTEVGKNIANDAWKSLTGEGAPHSGNPGRTLRTPEQKARDDAIKAMQEELDRELQDLRDANDLANAADAGAAANKPQNPGDLPGAPKGPKTPGPAIAAPKTAIGLGTFNPFGFRGGSTVMMRPIEKTQKATEKTAAEAEKLRKQQERTAELTKRWQQDMLDRLAVPIGQWLP